MNRATFTNDRITSPWVLVSFPYDPDYVEIIKRVVPKGSRSYNANTKAWTIGSHYRRTLENAFDQLERIRANRYDTPPQRAAHHGTRPLDDVFRELFTLIPEHLRTPTHRALMKVAHPDVGGDTEMAKALNMAWAEVAA